MKLRPHRLCSLVAAWLHGLMKPEERETMFIRLREEPFPWEKNRTVRAAKPRDDGQVSDDGAAFLSVMSEGV